MGKDLVSIMGEKVVGGMGAGISNGEFVRAVSNAGGFAAVSGTASNEIMVRRLAMGDPTGETINALGEFPDQEIANRIIDKYYIPGGKEKAAPFKSSPFPRFNVADDKTLTLKSQELEDLIIVANFAEIKIAKRGHDKPVGVNYLHKIQWPLMPSIYGAMLAGVDVVLIGAGLPRGMENVLDSFAEGRGATMQIPVIDKNGNWSSEYSIQFSPRDSLRNAKKLKRPAFVGIISSHLAAKALFDADGYVAEVTEEFEDGLGNKTYRQVAGGHHAPARNGKLTENGEPDYGPKDLMDYDKFNSVLDRNAKNKAVALGRNPDDPSVIEELRQHYWLAGGFSDKLGLAKRLGAAGVQVGSIAGFARESGMDNDIRRKTLGEFMNGENVFTDPYASPSGFPFEVAQIEGTLSSTEVYDARRRVCNLGYLGTPVESDGGVILRCPAEPVESYLRKGGNESDTYRAACLCNGLLATEGCGSHGEPAIVTTGSRVESVKEMVRRHGIDYPVRRALEYMDEFDS